MAQKACPQWAAEMIEQLRQVEIFLGNLPRESGWNSDSLEKVYQRTFEADKETFNEEKSHLIFTKIIKGLNQEGHDKALITLWLNERLSHGRLKYCDESEIEEVLLTMK